MSEQEEKVLYYCREWYRTGREVIKQTLWYEIGVMLENEPDAEHRVQATWGGLFLADSFIRSKPPQAPNANPLGGSRST